VPWRKAKVIKGNRLPFAGGLVAQFEFVLKGLGFSRAASIVFSLQRPLLKKAGSYQDPVRIRSRFVSGYRCSDIARPVKSVPL
jgi:hypothetical protein